MAAGTEITQPVDAIAERSQGNKGNGDIVIVQMQIGTIHISQSIILEESNEPVKESEFKEGPMIGACDETLGMLPADELTPCHTRPLPPRGFTRGFSEASLALNEGYLGNLETSSSSVGNDSEGLLRAVDETSTFTPVLRSGRCTDIGRRSYMEDVHVLVDDLTDFLDSDLILASPRAFYGVFDGHGGKAAADFASQHLLRHIVEDPAFPAAIAFQRGFQRTDLALEKAWASAGSCQCDSGTTALTVFVCGNSLVVANAGDCRAVLSRKGRAVELSQDQKPSSPAEKARIEAAGGFVEDDYLNGQLGVARALGDWHMQGLKRRDALSSLSPLTSDPEVREEPLTAEDEFMILGCDGLWDVFSSQNAVEYARRRLQQHNDPEACSRELVAEALKRHTSDNLTVVTVCFGNKPPPKLARPWNSGVRRCISENELMGVQSILDKSQA